MTKHRDLITTLHYLTLRPAFEAVHNAGQGLVDHNGEPVALSVTWSERHGPMETSTLEYWRQVAPNIFVVTSQKK